MNFIYKNKVTPCLLRAACSAACSAYDTYNNIFEESYDPVEILQGDCRERRLVIPRQIAMFLLRTEAKTTYMSIAEAFNRSHRTVLYAVTTIKGEVSVSKERKREVELAKYLYTDIIKSV